MNTRNLTAGSTIGEKILAAASGRESVQPGDVIEVQVSAAVLTDGLESARARQWMETNDVPVWDKDRVAFAFDHIPRSSLDVHAAARRFGRERGVRVFDIGEHGLSHQVPAEHGYVLPGTVYWCIDTQAPTMGALGAFAIAATGDVSSVLAFGRTWLQVPESFRVTLSGEMRDGITGKDLFMRVAQEAHGTLAGKVVEYTGPGVANVPMDYRFSICNGPASVSGVTGIIAPDDVTLAWLRGRLRDDPIVLASDADARYAGSCDIDMATVEPMIAFPPDPGNVHDLSEIEGIPVHQAYIGSCSSARLDDLELAARIVRGRKADPAVRFIVTPISSEVAREATRRGLMQILSDAGATITTPGCGACFAGNQSPGYLDDGEVCITSSVDNDPGRMGSTKASIYIGSAGVVAASALEGKIADPRRYLS